MGQFGGNVTLEQLETKKSDADTSNYLRPTVENVEDLVPFDERGGREWYDPLVSSQTGLESSPKITFLNFVHSSLDKSPDTNILSISFIFSFLVALNESE